MDTLANSEDPDEMQHNAAFHQCLHCLLRYIQSSWIEVHNYLEIITCATLKCINGQFHPYCTNMYGKIHQNTKGYCTFGALNTVLNGYVTKWGTILFHDCTHRFVILNRL